MDPMLVSATAADLEAPLEDWGPRVGADRGQPMTAGRIMHDADGVQVGVWSCTPGSWELLDRSDTETIRILAGRARLTNAADGSSVELGVGDVLVLPKGWSGRWEILEPVRKLYVLSR
jgi:uncharacterized cupin superfamily protein